MRQIEDLGDLRVLRGAAIVLLAVMVFLYTAVVKPVGLSAYVVPSVLWLIIFTISWKDVSKYRGFARRLLPAVPILAVIRVIIDLFVGSVTGFGLNTAAMEPATIAMNLLRSIPLVLGMESLRVFMLNILGRNHVKSVLVVSSIMTVLTFSPLKLAAVATGGSKEVINFLLRSLTPSLANNTFLTQLAAWGSVKTTITYSLLINLYIYATPILPDVPWYIIPLTSTVVPLAQLIVASSIIQAGKTYISGLNRKSLYASTATILIVAVTTLSIFATGSRIAVVMSGSMEPSLNIGDVVLLTPANNLKVGDIIAYSGQRTIIIHRIVSVKKDKQSNIVFITKGDANDDPDPYEVTNITVLGRLTYIMPRIGLFLVYGAKLAGGFLNLVTLIVLAVFFLHFISLNKEVQEYVRQ